MYPILYLKVNIKNFIMNLFYNLYHNYIIDVEFIFLGRVTRARRNKTKSPETPQKYRETRKRIQSIIDSDSD